VSSTLHTVLSGVLGPGELARIVGLATGGSYVDGRATSELAAKSNLQLPVGSEAATEAGALVLDALRVHAELDRVAQPVAITPPLFSRYEPGMSYPDHVDVAVMGGLRTDLAMTVFLSDPADYDGGDLVVDTRCGERRYRLAAGDAIVYPASTVHRVEPVRRGVRLVAVAWAQSLIRDAERRRLVVDLATAADAFAGAPPGPRLRRAHQNLLRMWAEPLLTVPATAGDAPT
jgi:PKHD-type hydroxylase